MPYADPSPWRGEYTHGLDMSSFPLSMLVRRWSYIKDSCGLAGLGFLVNPNMLGPAHNGNPWSMNLTWLALWPTSQSQWPFICWGTMGGQFEFQKFLNDIIIFFLPEFFCIAPNFLPTTLLCSMSANLFLLALHLCYRYIFLTQTFFTSRLGWCL